MQVGLDVLKALKTAKGLRPQIGECAKAFKFKADSNMAPIKDTTIPSPEEYRQIRVTEEDVVYPEPYKNSMAWEDISRPTQASLKLREARSIPGVAEREEQMIVTNVQRNVLAMLARGELGKGNITYDLIGYRRRSKTEALIKKVSAIANLVA